MSNFENWTEITKGLYRYVIGANVCYEIHILYHNKKRDILRANASLFVVGDWYDKTGKSFFERECLLHNVPVFDCLEFAERDYKENE